MKKAFLVLTVALVFAGSFVCDAIALDASKHIDLKLNFRAGEKRDMKITQDMNITQTMQGQEMEVVQNQEMVMGIEVLSVDANGVAEIKMTYKSMKVKMSSPQMSMEYDSTKPPVEGSDPSTQMMQAVYSSMTGGSVMMKVNPKGEASDVRGLGDIMKNATEKLGPEAAAMKQFMSQLIDEDKLKDTMGDMFGVFPEGLVAVGDTWFDSAGLDIGFPIDIETTYMLKRRDKGMAYVDSVAKMDMGTEKSIDMGGMKMGFQMAGAISGASVIDEVSGWTLSSSGVMNITGVLKMGANPQMPDGMTMPMKIEGVFKVETIDVK